MSEKDPKKKPKSETLRGVVEAVNISPRGDVEGLLVTTSKGRVQVNLPKEPAPGRAPSRVGEAMEVRVEREADGDHPVYRLRGDDAAAEGTVVRLNYARHGEVNGVHLDDGTFVHLKPDGAREHALVIGERIAVEGRRKAGADAVVIDAVAVKRVPRGSKVSASGRRRDPAALRCPA